MRILITGGRTPLALDLARHFHNAGHEIYVAETSKLHICRFSNAVTDSFVVPSPRFDSDAFINRLVDIADEEKIDLLIPTCEEIFYISRDIHRFSKECTIFSSSFEVLDRLHNKWLFHTKLKSMNLYTPDTVLIQNQKDLNNLDLSTPYALKACYSRASQKMVKLEGDDALPNLDIQSADPWIAQSWIKGRKYCTYSVCQEGRILAHTAYPVRFTVDQYSCVFFRSIEHSPIQKWVESFVKAENFTGQIAFDFIENEEGRLFAIECNPRSTSGLHLFRSEDRIDQAFLNENTSTIYPKKGRRKQIAIGMLLYGWKTAISEKTLGSYFKNLFSSQDVVFSFKDLKPFFMQSFVCFTYILTSLKLKLSLPAMFMHDLEFNGENKTETDLTQVFEPERID